MAESESRGPLVNAIAIAFAVISFITLCLRLFARVFISKSIGPDDYLICVAVLLSWGFIGCTIASVQKGLGSHIDDVTSRGIENMVRYSQIVWLSSIFYNACLGFIKVSVLSLYRRLRDPTLSKLSVILMGVIICQATANVLVCIFQCSPIQGAWDITIPPTELKCIDINAFYLANAAVNIFTDLLTYTLPIPLVTKLQMPRRKKIGVAVILCLGLFACVSSIVRITYVPPMLSSSDPTFVIADAMYWSIIETNVGILAASIPSFNIILNKFVQSASQANSKYSYSHSNSKGQGLQMTPMGSHKNHYTEVGSSKDGAPTQKGHGDSEEELVLQHQGITVETRVDVESKSIG